MRIGEQLMRDNKGTVIFNTRLYSSCILAVMCALSFTTCFLEGDLEALRPLGSGTETDPFKVFDVATLQRVGSGRYGWELNMCYEQIAPIDLSSVANWDPIGTESAPFTGNFNGQGFQILNLTIDKPLANNQGLFGVIDSKGIINNVNLVNVKISGNNNTGAVAGISYGTITNCCSTGSVNGKDYVGGLTGLIDIGDDIINSEITNCYSTCNVTGTNYVGGVAGGNNKDYGTVTITNCYSTGRVIGTDYVGGLIGIMNSDFKLEYCIALGPSVDSTGTNIGRVAGSSIFSSLSNNYGRIDTLINTKTLLENGLSESYKNGFNVDADSYSGGSVGYYDQSFWESTLTLQWDFNNTWEMENGDLPILKNFPDDTQYPEIQYNFPLTNIKTIKDYLKRQSGGNDADYAVELPIKIDLGDMTQADSGWQILLGVIDAADKFVNLELSECDMSGIEFNPVGNISTGKNKIVELTLPGTTQKIVAGSDDNGAFKNFNSLKSVTGEIIDIIGNYAFFNCTALENVSLTSTATIGSHAFKDCTSLVNVDLDNATYISDSAFAGCTSLVNVSFSYAMTIEAQVFSGCTKLESVNLSSATFIGFFSFQSCIALKSVTLGSTVPNLGESICNSIVGSEITIMIPSTGATDYTPYPDGVSGDDTSSNWANGFRGGGWDENMTTSTSSINKNIAVVFSVY